MTKPEEQRRHVVAAAKPRLAAISDSQAAVPRGQGKWSAKEIVGHLIDSASNNHQRFVRAQFTDDLVCAGYDQDSWVASQRYQSAPWDDLLALWVHFNLHLAPVM